MRFFANINDVCWHLALLCRLVLNNDFAEQISLPEMPPCSRRIAELMNAIDHRMNVMLNQYVNHVFEIAPAADRNWSKRCLRGEHRHEVDAAVSACENAHQRDLAADCDGFDRLLKRGWAAAFNNAVDAASPSSEFPHGRPPLGGG